MNDFLQSIRNGNFSKDTRPRYNQQKPRRNYDNNSNGNGNYNKGNNNDRKFHNKAESPVNNETLKSIKTTLETIASNQTGAMEIATRRADAEERKAAAFEFIASTFGDFVPAQPEKHETVVAVVKAEVENIIEEPIIEEPIIEEPITEVSAQAPVKSYEISKNTNTEMNKDEVLSMILGMRNDGSTYNEIASHLVTLDLPTFSGRGKWHAQTIHRLCQSV
jgi:hypothetical protein